MNKTKVLMALCLSMVLSAGAQHRIEISVDGYYDIHNRAVKNDMYGLGVTGAYRLSPHWRVGIATGIGNLLWDQKTSETQRKEGMHDNLVYLPLEAHVKYNLFRKGITPYLAFNAGYCFSLTAHNGGLGTTFKPMIGVDIPCTDKLACYLQVGYNLQDMTRSIYHEGASFGYYNGRSQSAPPTRFKYTWHGELIEYAIGLTLKL